MSKPQPLDFEKTIYDLESQIEQLEQQPNTTVSTKDAIRTMWFELTKLKRETYQQLDPWQHVKVARHDSRPKAMDYIELVFDEFVELHGDKAFGDDRAILTGFAKLDEQKVMLIAQQKGRNLEERLEHNYGMAHPEGYRKALMKMEAAAKYNLPIICLIDTAGAFPGIGAEERGQAYQIALNLREMSRIKTPIVCVVIGEGGSGGALGIGIGDHVAILEFAYYSVISPEGCAGILWKGAEHASKAAHALKFTPKDLLGFGVVDEIIEEPIGGAHRDHRKMAMNLKASLVDALKKLGKIRKEDLLDHRYQRFRKLGMYSEQMTEQLAAVASNGAEASSEQANS